MESTVSSRVALRARRRSAAASSRSSCRTSAIMSTTSSISGDRFIVRSNWRARNFRLASAAIGAFSDRSALAGRGGASRRCVHRGLRRIRAISSRCRCAAAACARSHPTAGRRAPNSSSPATRPPTAWRSAPIREMDTRHRALRLFLAHHADDRVRLQHAHAASRFCASAIRCSADFDPANYATEFLLVSARDGAHSSGIAGLPQGHARDGTRAAAAIRLWRLRRVDGPGVLLGAA